MTVLNRDPPGSFYRGSFISGISGRVTGPRSRRLAHEPAERDPEFPAPALLTGAAHGRDAFPWQEPAAVPGRCSGIRHRKERLMSSRILVIAMFSASLAAL